MATVTLRPNGNGDVNTCDCPSGAHWDAVNDVVSDDDATVIIVDGNNSPCIELYTIEANSIGVSDTISQIEIFAVLKSEDSKFLDCSFALYLKENSVYTVGSVYFDATTTYSTFSQVFAVKPSNSTAWTKSDIDNLQIGLYSNSDGPGYTYCTQMYVVVSYTTGSSVAISKKILMKLETDD